MRIPTTLVCVALLAGCGTPAPTDEADSAFAADRNVVPGLLGRESGTGALWYYPGDGRGGFLPRVQVGQGWSGMDLLLGAGDFSGHNAADLLAREAASGDLWLYPGDGKGGFTTRVRVGSGWSGLRDLAAPGDFDGDGHPDVVARDPAGAAWLYPGTGQGFAARRPIDAALDGIDRLIAAGDLDGDGHGDLLGRESATGDLWLYPGDGTGSVAPRRPATHDAGLEDLFVGVGDFDGDGHSDLLAREPSTGTLWLHPGDGRGGFVTRRPIGNGWQLVDAVAVSQVGTPTPLPGGRAYYVATTIGDRTPKAVWVRLAELTFKTDGTVSMDYWYWNQAQFSGNALNNKVVTATTRGCYYTCDVKAPLGFQRSAKPKNLKGTFRYDAAGNVVLTWTSASETWKPTHFSVFTRMDLAASTAGATGGWAFGSKTPLTTGVPLDQVRAVGTIKGPYWSSQYDAPTAKITDSFPFSAYNRCGGDESLQNQSVSNPDKMKRWSSYLAGDYTVDGRKMYWNHQRAAVTQAEAPGSNCISPLGGHTFALLQIVDDNGAFWGWVSAEASQHQKYTGGDLVSIAALTR